VLLKCHSTGAPGVLAGAAGVDHCTQARRAGVIGGAGGGNSATLAHHPLEAVAGLGAQRATGVPERTHIPSIKTDRPETQRRNRIKSLKSKTNRRNSYLDVGEAVAGLYVTGLVVGKGVGELVGLVGCLVGVRVTGFLVRAVGILVGAREGAPKMKMVMVVVRVIMIV
jgi:hypothetical protein